MGKWIGAAILVFVLYYLLENYAMLRLRRYSISCPAYTGAPRQLLVISDLHCKRLSGAYRRMLKKACAVKPDYILLPGDMISRDNKDVTAIARIFSALSDICPVYFSFGNHELDLPEQMQMEIRKAAATHGITLLENASVQTEDGFWIAGASLKRSLYRDENNRFRHLQPYTANELRAALGERKGMTVLLAHNPLCMDAYAEWGADAVVSGHMHGGAVRIPFVCGLLSPERRFFPRYAKGCYQKGDTTMLVCGGMGKRRLFNPPEICLVSLHRGDGVSERTA